MLWYIAVENKAKEIPEEVLIYKIKNEEISPDTLAVNEEIKEWTPLKNTKLYREQYGNHIEENANSQFITNIGAKSLTCDGKNTEKTGTVVIYGYTGWFLVKPNLKIYLNGKYIGDLSYKARSKEIQINEVSTIEIKCHIRSTEVRVFPEGHTEIYTEFDRATGSIIAEVRRY